MAEVHVVHTNVQQRTTTSPGVPMDLYSATFDDSGSLHSDPVNSGLSMVDEAECVRVRLLFKASSNEGGLT